MITDTFTWRSGMTVWPETQVHKRAWRTNPDQHGPNGARPNQADRMLTEIEVEVPPHIAARDVPLGQDTRAAVEQAARDVIEFDQGIGRHLAPLAEFMLRSESIASSRIEHVNANTSDLARAILGEQAGTAARSIIAAVSSLSLLTRSCDDGEALTETAILHAHRDLLQDDLLESGFAGTYRTMQNWLGGSDFSPRTAVHIPPPAAQVGGLMEDLVAFANRNDLPAVAQAAVVHAQFEAIHPFTDGNGRIGRALIATTLRRRGLARHSVVPIASVMLADVDEYFDALAAYRRGDVNRFVDYLAVSAMTATAAADESASRILALPDRWLEGVKARRGSSTRTLIEGLTAHPVLDIRIAESVTGTTVARTYTALNALTESGILIEITGNGRNRMWVAADVMTEIDALNERVGARKKPSRRWH